MGIERIAKTGLMGAIAFVLFLLFTSVPVKPASAQVIIQLPLSQVNSEFKMRWGRRHTGVDLQAATPTDIPINGSASCETQSGYGIIASVARACGVVERYAHLSQCSANKIVTGSSGDTSGNQGVAQAHLHYEVLINGTFVDPQFVAGKDLCDASVREAAIADANTKLNGNAGGGGGAGAGSNAPAPPAQPTDSIVEVPTGGTDPNTGVVNNGPAYYVVTTPDGRTYTEYVPSDEPTTHTTLPPTTSIVVPPGSSSNEVTGCGTDTWRAMVNQAVLQTRREMLMNQRYIAKADSVMAYSCFSDMLANAGEYLGVFSETRMWVNKEVPIIDGHVVIVNVYMGANSLDGAITNAALEPYEAWLRSNFNHDFLGGLLGAGGRPGGGGEGEEGNSVQSMAPCGIMAQVWQQAKCMNMTDQPMFYRFEELIGNDPRKYPPNYACHDSGIFQNMIDIAKNKEAEFSKVETHLNRIRPLNGVCAPPLATGVTVTTREGADRLTTELTYPDALCITAGCSYQRSGGSAGVCEIKAPRLGSR